MVSQSIHKVSQIIVIRMFYIKWHQFLFWQLDKWIEFDNLWKWQKNSFSFSNHIIFCQALSPSQKKYIKEGVQKSDGISLKYIKYKLLFYWSKSCVYNQLLSSIIYFALASNAYSGISSDWSVVWDERRQFILCGDWDLRSIITGWNVDISVGLEFIYNSTLSLPGSVAGD